MAEISEKITILRQLGVETQKYSRIFKYLPQYDIDARNLERYIFQLERELAGMISQLEMEKQRKSPKL